VAAYLMNSLSIPDSVRSGPAQERKVTPDVINAMNFLVSISNIFQWLLAKKAILDVLPYRREVGTEKRIQDEEARYISPECGNKVFRGVRICNQCKVKLDLD
jgi:hypothetical protein